MSAAQPVHQLYDLLPAGSFLKSEKSTLMMSSDDGYAGLELGTTHF